jgi:parallel beta-helix repeat protein
VNETASGGTLNVTGCGPYREVVTITRPMTLIGASITGGNAAQQSGNIQITATSNVTVDGARVSDSGGACISADNSSYVTVRNSLMSGCAQEGYHFSHMDHLLFTGNRVTGNNPQHAYSWGWEAGGGKTCFTTNSTFSNNEVDHNVGPGLWFDCNDSGITISGNRVHDNVLNGIHWETALSGSIVNNVVWNNDRTIASEYGWGWGAGILLSSSANTEVSGNTVAWNGDGIVVLSQNRDDQPASGIVGNYVHDNRIFGTDAWPDSNQNYTLGWLQDWSGVMFSSSSGNRSSGNQFFYAAPEGASRWAWDGRDYSGLTSFASTPGGSGSTYLSSTQATTILNASGVPLAP